MDNHWSKVAVVVLCWNGRKFLEEFLPTLVQFNIPEADIVVADNYSTDDSAEYVKKNFPSVRLIGLEKNFGFAEGYNQAIKQIDSEYIVLINQDVAVSPNWLSPLIKLMEDDPRTGAVQPRIHAHLQRSHFEYAGAAGGWIDQYGYTFCRGRILDFIEEDHDQYNQPAEIFWASGACMIVRKKVYEEMGGLDTNLFAHMEEIDLCWRLKNAGYKIMYCPDSTVYHLGGGSLPQGNPFKTYLNFRNNLIIITKNLPKGRVINTLLIRAILDQVAALRWLLMFQFKDFIAVWKAQLHFLLHLREIRRKRAVTSTFLRMTGVYEGSIVWQYFVKKKKKFTDIVKEN